MSYQVLARKYRPQTFAEVVGQGHITTTLRNALACGRIHHAYLFTGARGVGKTTVARILAKALNCENRKGEEPCGVCGPCVEITAGKSLDVQEIDGASNTSVDDVREIRERVKYMPASGRYKIYIIDEVHMLSGNAFNALLKTLEEPPAHVIFIFATTEAHKIPATILSRCQRHDFRRIPKPKIVETLNRVAKEEGVSIDNESVRLIAHEATGSLRDAESLFDQAIAYAGNEVSAESIKEMLGFLDRKRIFDLLAAVTERNPQNAIAVLDDVFNTGADLVRFSLDILEMLRHLLVMAECKEDAAIDLLPDEVELLRQMLGKTGTPELQQMFSIWYGVAESVARSTFPKMLLEVGLIRLCRVGTVRPIAEIVAKLDSIIGAETKAADTPREKVAKAPAQPPQVIPTATPAFEPAPAPKDFACEKKWEEFMRWVVAERPQIASILQNGELEGIDDGVVKLSFENPLYADMLTEVDRKELLESLFKGFFKRAMKIEVSNTSTPDTKPAKKLQKREIEREALGSDIVKQAVDILNAELYEVKVEGEK